ncbi:MAG: ADP-ribosylation factor-like protein [Promethearchaeota archaeon]
MNRLEKSSENIIQSIIFSVFEREGPIPICCIPAEIPEEQQLLIAMKSISLLMGEQVYQDGQEISSIKYFGILPFPDMEITGLTYFFLISDESARGKAKAATISLLVKNYNASVLYEQMKDLSIFMGDCAKDITKRSNREEIRENILKLYETIDGFLNHVKIPLRKERNIKILFTGLDASGKTSFLRAIKQKYSELTGIKPTRGVERHEEVILGQNLMEWDVGGQMKYRTAFLKQADLYLYDTNLLFFLVDMRDLERFPEMFDFFTKIIRILESFNQYPPVIVNLHKIDPDIEKDPSILDNINQIKSKLAKIAHKFQVKFCKTSIFNPYSLIKSFSAGIGSISPNRDILRGQLKWLANQSDAEAILLLNNSSIIISDYSINEVTKLVSEISAPHFQNLYRTFSDFKLLKKKKAIWQMDKEMIIFIRIDLLEESLYLMALIKSNPKIVEKMDNLVSEFVNRILPLVKSFL